MTITAVYRKHGVVIVISAKHLRPRYNSVSSSVNGKTRTKRTGHRVVFHSSFTVDAR